MATAKEMAADIANNAVVSGSAISGRIAQWNADPRSVGDAVNRATDSRRRIAKRSSILYVNHIYIVRRLIN